MWSQKKATWEGLKSNCTGRFFKRMKTEMKFSFLQQKTLLFEKTYKNVFSEDFILLTSMRKYQDYY